MNRRAWNLSESRCYVAAVWTVFPLPFFICSECFSACRTLIAGHALSFSLFGMLVPPLIPACVTTESRNLSPWIYRNGTTAIIALFYLCHIEFVKPSILPKSMSDAVGFNRTSIHACHFCQRFVANALSAHSSDNSLVFFCHFLTPAFLLRVDNYSLRTEEKSSVVFDTLTRTHYISCESLIPAHEHIIIPCANMKPLRLRLRFAKQLCRGFGKSFKHNKRIFHTRKALFYAASRRVSE